MGRDVLRRVRWSNVSLAGVVLVALAAVVVWPLVSTTPPGLPPDAARPLVGEEPAPNREGQETPRGEAAASVANEPRTHETKRSRRRRDEAAGGASARGEGRGRAGERGDAGGSGRGGSGARGEGRGRAGERDAGGSGSGRSDARGERQGGERERGAAGNGWSGEDRSEARGGSGAGGRTGGDRGAAPRPAPPRRDSTGVEFGFERAGR